VGPGAKLCTLLEVWVLGVGMSTLGAQTALYTEYRGPPVPMTLEHGLVTSSGALSEDQSYDSDRHVSVYPSGPH
jgi:hypothetical protein